ncbi:MAG: hypothetical protein ACSHYA_16975 [Opitutaceae bacterium]
MLKRIKEALAFLRLSYSNDQDFLYSHSKINNYTKNIKLLIVDLKKRHGKKIRDSIYSNAEMAREKLIKAGVPNEYHQVFINFQLKYGGLQSNFGFNRVIWGILHSQAQWMKANEIDAAEEKDVWHISCADVHGCNTVTIDQNGKLYFCWNEWFPHYEDYFATRDVQGYEAVSDGHIQSGDGQ